MAVPGKMERLTNLPQWALLFLSSSTLMGQWQMPSEAADRWPTLDNNAALRQCSPASPHYKYHVVPVCLFRLFSLESSKQDSNSTGVTARMTELNSKS